MFDAFFELPKVSDTLIIRYIDRGNKDISEEVRIKYDEKWLKGILGKDFLFWNKKKSPEPVPKEESWKCRSCYFLKINKCQFGANYLKEQS